MNKLTGYGRPSNHLEGIVGQHYEDLNTGDIYECRIANRWSPTHGSPVGGYIWELRAKGEDIQDIYGSSEAPSWNDLKDKPFGETFTSDETLITTLGQVRLKNGAAKLSDLIEHNKDFDGRIIRLNVSSLNLAPSLSCKFVLRYMEYSANGDYQQPHFVYEPVGDCSVQITFDNDAETYRITIPNIEDDYCTFQVYMLGVIILPLPEKYMPTLTSPSGKRFKLAVDDNGTVTTTEVAE